MERHKVNPAISENEEKTEFQKILMGPLPLLYKAFFRPVLTYASPEWFPFLTVTNICKVKRLHRAASRAITGCLSSSLIPILSEASLPSLQFTRTHFALSSNERALRLPTSFSISLLARPGSETKTLKIFLESFCVHSPVYAPFYFS